MSSVPRAAVGRGTCMPRALLLQEQPLLCRVPIASAGRRGACPSPLAVQEISLAACAAVSSGLLVSRQHN